MLFFFLNEKHRCDRLSKLFFSYHDKRLEIYSLWIVECMSKLVGKEENGIDDDSMLRSGRVCLFLFSSCFLSFQHVHAKKSI